MNPEPHHLSRAGFSLLEVLLALTITLVVMALVAQTMGNVSRIYETQSDLAVSSGAAALALDDIAFELSIAGQGIGEGPSAVLARRPGSNPSAEAMTLRSNPEVAASFLRSELADPNEEVAADSSEKFEEGDRALVADRAGLGERAEVVRVLAGALELRSLETSDGSFRRPVSPDLGARVLGLREVSYYLEEPRADGRRRLIKEVLGVGSRVLSPDVLSLEFEYLDSEDEPLSLAKVESSRNLASIRVTLRYLPGENALAPIVLATRVALDPTSGTIDFEKRDLGFRLSGIFYPIDHPTAVASRIGADWALILASGTSPTQDPAYLYTFEMEKRFLSASVDDVVFLEDVRAPVALAFGPENGPLAGSLFVAAWGLRIGHLSRVAPDESGRLSRDSAVTTFEGTEAIAQAGGIAFGADDALYVASQEKGAIFRFRFGANGKPGKPERIYRLTGTPGAIAEGADGHLYFLMNHGERGSLWKMAFDETLAPQEPVLVGPLPGLAVSLASDPVGGDLFALVRDGSSDFVVTELSRSFLSGKDAPRVVFSLRQWRTRLQDGDIDPREIPFPTQELPQRLAIIGVEELDSLSFDALGSLYMGNREKNVVLEFELDRPSGRYAVGLAAGTVERSSGLAPVIRMHAWKKTGLGS